MSQVGYQASLITRALALALASVFIAAGAICISSQRQYSLDHWLIKEFNAGQGMDRHTILVDVRSASDYAQAHIPGAISLDPAEWGTSFPVFLEYWSPERPVLVYCSSGACGLSKEIALKLLEDLPGINISVLKGGFPAWRDNNKTL